MRFGVNVLTSKRDFCESAASVIRVNNILSVGDEYLRIRN